MSVKQLKQDAPSTSIAGIDEPTILQYFIHLNTGDFAAVSQLFAVDGVLQPPFEERVIGRDAIATYLEREAKGFVLQPQTGHSIELENNCTELKLSGKVQTSWFAVNIRWTFILNPLKEIFLVEVKLLAALEELLPLRSREKHTLAE